MNHVAGISSGLSSAVMYRRLLARYGADSVVGVFEDTLIEDADNYRFLAEIEAWGRPFVRLAEGRDPYQVAEDKQIIPNQKIAPCTAVLKIQPFMRWIKSTYPEPGEVTIHIGYDFSEMHRCAATRRNYEAAGYHVDFPLLWKPYEYRPYAQVAREDWGIEPPRMYAQGYSHANCGGLCVKQGKRDWLRTLVLYPDRYARREAWEQRMREHPTRANYALLRHVEGGVQRPMTLRELRERHEAGTADQLSLVDEPGCVTCGVGDLLAA